MKNDIHYEIQGEGTPLLFLHGLGGDLQQAASLLTPITGIQKITVDCPGHGQSPVSDESLLSFDVMADLIMQLMDELCIPQFMVGGISMGAGISANMMVRYPERISGAILVRPAWLDIPDPDNLSILLRVADYCALTEGLIRFESLPEFQAIRSSLPIAADSILGQFQRPQGARSTAALLRAMIHDAPVRALATISGYDGPCCIIVNEQDPLHPAAFGPALQQYLSQAELHDVYPRYLDPERHNEEVREVIRYFI
ncbi:MAG: alpha/beta hydrolase [Saprospiraceae bacterium]|nr:alpha/beta hydrolase [Lewinella sp.]